MDEEVFTGNELFTLASKCRVMVHNPSIDSAVRDAAAALCLEFSELQAVPPNKEKLEQDKKKDSLAARMEELVKSYHR